MDTKFQKNDGNTALRIRLCKLMCEGKEGDTFTDAKLKELIGVDLSTKGKHCSIVYQAMKDCRKKTGLVWERVPFAGVIKCLDDAEKVDSTLRKKKHIHKTAIKAIRTAEAVNIGKLKPHEVHQFTANMAAMKLVHMSTSNEAMKRLEQRNVDISKEKLFELFDKDAEIK